MARAAEATVEAARAVAGSARAGDGGTAGDSGTAGYCRVLCACSGATAVAMATDEARRIERIFMACTSKGVREDRARGWHRIYERRAQKAAKRNLFGT